MDAELLRELMREDWIVDFLGVDAVAAHEAAHAVVARHLGWHVELIVLRDAAGPRTEVTARVDVDDDLAARERLVITCAGRAADVRRSGDADVPWSAGDIGTALELADQLAAGTGATSEQIIEDAEAEAARILDERQELHELVARRLAAAGRLAGADVDAADAGAGAADAGATS